jgi:hypothetical protein
MLLAKQYETNFLYQCGIIADLSMQYSQVLVASSPSYLYSGIIATHLPSQALMRQILRPKYLSPIMLDEHSISTLLLLGICIRLVIW